MRTALLLKISVWLVIIGTAALAAPNPAWPEWASRMVLSTGIALALTIYINRLWKRRSGSSKEKKE
jgi:membrane protein implicated in regulation of membrane protease activity